MPLEDEFSDIISKARFGKKLAAADVTKSANISESQLTQLEDGSLTPTESQVMGLAKVLGLDGAKLLDIALHKWTPKQLPSKLDPQLEAITLDVLYGMYHVNCYLLACSQTKETAIIDTGGSPDTILSTIKSRNLKPKYVLLTHTHGDHAAGLKKLQDAFGCEALLHKDEPAPSEGKKLSRLSEGDEVELGKLKIRTLLTPGHTPGGISFLVNKVAFVGDAIFAGSLGRANFSYTALLDSVKNKLLSLPQDVAFFPGHGPATTAGEEREHNPFF